MVLLISVLIIASAITFALGIVLPLIEFKNFYIFTETTSLIDIIWLLFNDGEYLLSTIVLVFSIRCPLAKQIFVLTEVVDMRTAIVGLERSLLKRLVPLLSKWSTMDVLLVATVISAAKISGIASAMTQAGLWFYALSALLTTVTHYLVLHARKQMN